MKNGFTLVELSITLVVVGLLIGGILIGQSMVESAKVLKLVNQLGQYETAVKTFRSKYKQYPGDSRVFNPAGDVNGTLSSPPSGVCTGIYSANETLQFFPHLSQAGMLKDGYQAFSPISCGGSHEDAYNSNAGIVGPYIEVDSRGSASLYWSMMGLAPRFIFQPSKAGNNNLGILFPMNAAFVIPLEQKIGPGGVWSRNSGIFNAAGNAGRCFASGFTITSCSSSSAIYGVLTYYMAP